MKSKIAFAAGACLVLACSNAVAEKQVEYRLNPRHQYMLRCDRYLPGTAEEQIRLRDRETKLSLTGQSSLVNSFECKLYGGKTGFTLTINGSSGAMVEATIRYPNDPTTGSGYFFKDDLIPAAASSAGTENDVLTAVKMRLGENVARHTLGYSVRSVAKVILTDMKCPEPVPDPRFNGGDIAFLIFDDQHGALPGCYVKGLFGGGIDLKWANGYGDSIQPDDLHLTARGAARIGN